MSHDLEDDLNGHARDKKALAYKLMYLFVTELNPVGWQVMHGGKASNSWRIYLPRENTYNLVWYFTGYGKGEIVARNEYHWDVAKLAGRVVRMKTEADVERFAKIAARQR